MKSPPLKPRPILKALKDHGVDFLLAGGFAVNAHGFERATGDVDIIPAPNTANFQRLVSALAELDAQVLGVGDFELQEMPLELTVANLELLGNWRLQTRAGILDLLQHIEPIVDTQSHYDVLKEHAVQGAVGGVDVAVIGLADLIKLKELAGRERDQLDIRALLEANDETGRL